jgi:Glutathione S-transferase, N-terminal domain
VGPIASCSVEPAHPSSSDVPLKPEVIATPSACFARPRSNSSAIEGKADSSATRSVKMALHAPYARGEQVGLLRRRLWPLSTLTAAQQFVSNRGQSGLVSDSMRDDGPPVQKFGSLNKVHSRGLTDMTLGLLDRGAWRADDPTRIKDGHFIRPPTTYHNFITADGRPGPTGQGDFPAEAGRYHLYVSLACPWAHRTLIFRRLKKLEDVISVSVVEPVLGNRGWEFGAGPGAFASSTAGGSSGHPGVTRFRYTQRYPGPMTHSVEGNPRLSLRGSDCNDSQVVGAVT